MRRTAPEEWNLAVNYHEHDVRAAEFIRTYMSIDFNGGRRKIHFRELIVPDRPYPLNEFALSRF